MSCKRSSGSGALARSAGIGLGTGAAAPLLLCWFCEACKAPTQLSKAPHKLQAQPSCQPCLLGVRQGVGAAVVGDGDVALLDVDVGGACTQ